MQRNCSQNTSLGLLDAVCLPPVQHSLGFCLNILGARVIQIVYSISVEFISILFPQFV